MSSDKTTPWSRLKGEPIAAYRAFVVYLELGPGRSIAKAHKARGGSGPGRVLERYSSKYNWVARAEAYDADNLQDRIAGRKLALELAKQKIHDETQDMISELRDLSRGKIRPGQVKVKTNRDGKPVMTQAIDPETGEVIEVAVTEELVSPRVRAQILQHLLGVAGVQSPRRIEHTGADGEPFSVDLRVGMRSVDPSVFEALASALNVVVDPNKQKQ